MSEVAEMVEWREALIDDAIAGLKEFEAELPNHRYNQWLYRLGVSMYVRQNAYHHTNHGHQHCFDFANIQVLEDYRGQGIMMEIMERWHTMHAYPVTYVESVSNADLARRLVAAGWIACQDPETKSYYKIK